MSLVFALFRVEQSYNIHKVLYLRSGARVWESSLSGSPRSSLSEGRVGALNLFNIYHTLSALLARVMDHKFIEGISTLAAMCNGH